MAEVSPRPATQIKNGIGRIVLNRIQKRGIVLTDVVIPSAIPVCLGHPIIIGDRHFCDATARDRPEVTHKIYSADFHALPITAAPSTYEGQDICADVILAKKLESPLRLRERKHPGAA